MTKKKPRIRFAGFDEEWEQRKFGEIVEKYEDFVATPKDGYTRLGIRSHAKGTFHSFVEKGKELETAKMYRVSSGKFIVNITFGWEHAVAITDESDAGKLVSHRFPQYTFHKNMIPEFFRYVIVDEKFRYHLWIASPGGAGRNRVLKLDEMLNYLMTYPKKEEQEKIALFFRNLDQLIALHQRKYDKLVNIKKAMLEKMFPKNGANVPEIRFKGFSGDWKRQKWLDTVDISTEMVDPKTGKYDELPHVAPGNIESFTGQLYDNIKLVKDENLISGKFHFYDSDIIYGKINPQLGKYVFARFEGLTSADAYVLNAKNGIVQEYLYTILQIKDFFDYSVAVSKRSGMPKINRDELNAYSFLAPFEEEQKQIGNMFLTLDKLITLHRCKLEKLKNIKKACIEKMFV